jgi:hypothetical protein
MTNVYSVNPDAPEVPEGLIAPVDGEGEVVVLLADEEAHERGWARLLARAVARRWSGSGLKVILADGDLAGSGLHELAGAANGEGVSDLVLYGASPGRVTRRVAEESFLFVPAGTVVAEPDTALSHPRWPVVLSHFRGSGCVLVLYLPDTGPGAWLAASAGDRVIWIASRPPSEEPGPDTVVLLGGPAQPPEAAVDAHAPGAERGTADAEAEPTATWEPESQAPPADREAVTQPELQAVIEAPSTQPPTPSVPSRSASSPTPGFPLAPSRSEEPTSAPAPRIPRRTVVLLLVLVGVVLGVLAAAWLGYIEIPGL